MEIDIYGDEEVCSSAKVYVNTVKAIMVQAPLHMGEISKRYPPMQTFSPHILCQMEYLFRGEMAIRKGAKCFSKPVEWKMVG